MPHKQAMLVPTTVFHLTNPSSSGISFGDGEGATDLGISHGENQGTRERLPSGRPKQAAAIRQGVDRLVMDIMGGKSYNSYQHKQCLMHKHEERQKNNNNMYKKIIINNNNDIIHHAVGNECNLLPTKC